MRSQSSECSIVSSCLHPARPADLSEASLSICLPLERTNLVFLVGGPPSPLYPPNQVVLYDAQADRAVAELDFREEVRGLAARRDRLFVALRRRVVIFVLGEGQTGLWREGTYQTADNPRGRPNTPTSQVPPLLFRTLLISHLPDVQDSSQ